MVYISQKMLQVLEHEMDKGWFTIQEVRGILGGARGEHLQVLLDMYVQGLVDLRNEREFQTTDQARRILEIWLSLDKPAVDPWIDSRIYTMLIATTEAGGYVPEPWSKILEERKLLFRDEIGLEAYELVDSLEAMERRLVVTKAIAAEILSVPEGPAEKKYFGSVKFLDSLEAMGLITRSLPNGAYISLTRAGRLLKKALSMLNIDAPYPVLLNYGIYAALNKVFSGEEISSDARTMLGLIGYLSGTGTPTKAASLALKAWRNIKNPPETPPFSVSHKELLLMRTIEEQWEKTKHNPEEAPTLKILKKKLEPGWKGEYYSITLTLYHLESMGLINREVYEKREVFKLTSYGKNILSSSHGKPSSTIASRALIEPDALRGPREDWVAYARDEGLLGPGGPTRYGLALIRAARQSSKSLFLTGLEGLILKRLPETKSIDKQHIIESFRKYTEDIAIALDKLETRGYIKTTPIGYIIITRIGKMIKKAIMGVEKGIATPINPPLITILKAVRELGTDDIAKLVNKTKLDIDTVKTALILARKAKYIGKGYSLTESGKLLLEIVEKIEKETENEKEL